jgi:hypothetical protein
MVRQYAEEIYPPGPGSRRRGLRADEDRFAMPWAIGDDA